MAQLFEPFDYDLGELDEPNRTVYGNTTATVVEDLNASAGKALELTRDFGGGERGIRLDDFLVSPSGRTEVAVSVRRAEVTPVVIRSAAFSRDNRYQLFQDVLEYLTAFTTRASYTHGLDVSQYVVIRCVFHLDQDLVQARVWPLGQAEPTVWHLDTTYDSSSDETTDHPLDLDITSTSSDHHSYIDFVGIGTDGDPAPTEPVSAGPTTPTNLTTTDITADSFRAEWTA